VIVVLINTAAAYGFEKKQWKGKEIVFWPFLVSMMLPSHITLIPAYLLIRKMGLYDSLWALIIPGGASAFFIFFYRQYLKTFPDEFLYVAEIDGAGELRKFFQILLPLTKPALATIAILTFMGAWQNFLWPLILLPSEEKKTLIVGIAEVVARESQMAAIKHERLGIINYGLISAGATIAFVPMLIIFSVFQKWFIRSIYSGGLK
jgi:ABC-type glycerol-3-phosphate transport system permease component